MKKYLIAAVVVLTITAALFCLYSFKDDGVKLVLRNSETGRVIETFDVSEETEFSVEFIHSVNKSPVKDVFVIRGGKI